MPVGGIRVDKLGMTYKPMQIKSGKWEIWRKAEGCVEWRKSYRCGINEYDTEQDAQVALDEIASEWGWE